MQQVFASMTIFTAAVYAIDLMAVLLSFIILQDLIRTSRLPVYEKNYIAVLVITCLIACLCDSVDVTFNGYPGAVPRILLYVVDFYLNFASVFGPLVILFLILRHVNGSVPRWVFYVGTVINFIDLVALTLNTRFPIFYTIDSGNNYSRCDGYWVVIVFNVLLLLTDIIICLVFSRKPGKNAEFPIWGTVIPIVLGATVQSLVFGLSMIWPFSVVTCAAITIGLKDELAERDMLTGLHNRFYLDRLMGKAFFLSRKHLIILASINDFHSINDVYGRSEGDAAIKAASELIASVAGRDKILIRTHGSEFCIISIYKDLETASEICGKINSAFAEYNKSSSKRYELSVSCGWAVSDPSRRSIDEALHVADQYLDREQNEWFSRHHSSETSYIVAVKNGDVYKLSNSITGRVAKEVINLYYSYSVYSDLTDDFYQVLRFNGSDWTMQDADEITTRISDWFRYFSSSPLCHPDDRENIAALADLGRLIQLFHDTDYKPFQLIYRRKDDMFASKYYTTKMVIVPAVDTNGHELAFIFNRRLINETETVDSELSIISENNGSLSLSSGDDNMIRALERDEETDYYTARAFMLHTQMLFESQPLSVFDLIMTDISGFHVLSAQYGEETAEAVLKKYSSAVRERAPKGAIIGRLNTDRFVILVSRSPSEPFTFSPDSFINNIEKSMPVSGVNIKLGIYKNVDKSLPVEEIIRRTRIVLSTNKKVYIHSYAYFDDAMEKKLNLERRIEADMKDAYNQHQFVVYYQPKHDANTGALVGAEALIRWKHPELGFLPPDVFIPVLERNGFITMADYYVLNETCEYLRRWLDLGLKVVPISVNSSRVDFEFRSFDRAVRHCTRAYNIPHELIHVEITESHLSSDLSIIASKLQLLRDLGIKIELDDFGKDYSSLHTLASLPIDVLKLDMAFASDLTDERRRLVISSSISLAKALNMATVAEGVETEEQLKIYRDMGVDRIQGYYFSKPLPREEFEEYLRKYS